MLLALSCSRALADDGSECAPAGRGTYVGAFGGGGCSSISNVAQLGTAFFTESLGGPLDVNARGQSGTHGVGLVGLQIGHEWSNGSAGGRWSLLPAVEGEGFYLGGTQRALVHDSGPRLPEHDFDNTFPMDNAVLLANVVLSIQSPSQALAPYVGGGIGAARVSISGADSPQINPPELGVNHFNSDPDASDWGFAAQAKIGVRLRLTDSIYVFTEYRFLYIDSTTYVFGSTRYPTHVPTTPWTVQFDDICNHLGVAGIGFNF